MKTLFMEKNEFFQNRDLRYSFDSLTKVLNRETTFEYVQDLMAHNKPFSFIICDVDNFKYVNDTYGHLVGDKVLVQCSENFMKVVDECGVVGRYGGDEFIIVIPDVVEYDDIWKLCRQINFSANDLILEELRGSNITLTLGTTRYPINGSSLEELMQKADKALYRGKQKGRNCFIIYLPEKHDSIQIGDAGKVLFNSMDMHYRVLNTLTHTNQLSENVLGLMHFLSSSLMLDHICIQTSEKMCCSVIYPLSPVKSFSLIPEDVLTSWTNANGFCSINDRHHLSMMEDDRLCHHMEQQKIGGAVYVKIEAFGKMYGFLRAESAIDTGRIWQNPDMDLLVVFAKTLAIMLYYNETDLNQIF